jgi:MerR family transcriptional regulator, heat shock protein HspR
MPQNYYYRKQIVEIFGFEEDFINELESEELIRSEELESAHERVFPLDQMERMRIICNLVRDLEVNLPGVEVILEMRENMIRMQRQFDQILEAIVQELKLKLPRHEQF